ncbi:restriction endonuclease [Paenibacillus odorifer]|uniref:restriction endonuclease n=1 Tax=Paenibacillus odorifer TaxID=189426 RepID=UPI000BA1103E|nr:restriction endonuclease [Paenibacillus odorifer]OZQ77406.1 hypothetical protein CA596_07500 [Paenibacillus odorifer]
MKNTGVKFEQKVFDALGKALIEEKLGLLPNSCKIFIQKGYYSKDRDKDIKVDVSIEIYVANANKPSLIWVWECKDYKKQIPVDDIEEFHAKLEQIGADKTKGTVITSLGSFQESSMKYADSKGIALARLMPDEQVNWLTYMMVPGMENNFNRNNAKRALTQVNYIAEEQDFFALTSDSKLDRTSSLTEFILSEFTSILKKSDLLEIILKKN